MSPNGLSMMVLIETAALPELYGDVPSQSAKSFHPVLHMTDRDVVRDALEKFHGEIGGGCPTNMGL